MREEPLKYGAPSGYLDWNETGFEGMTREVYEETSLYLPNYEPFLIFDNNKQPFFVQDDPKKDKNQNISLIYLLAYDFSSDPVSFPIESEKYTNSETTKVEWLKLSDFFNEGREWAFNHDERIVTAHKFFNANFIRK
jgi:ADP-ribose pyrophosphatase YjhB (NUDIX family)